MLTQKNDYTTDLLNWYITWDYFRYVAYKKIILIISFVLKVPNRISCLGYSGLAKR